MSTGKGKGKGRGKDSRKRSSSSGPPKDIVKEYDDDPVCSICQHYDRPISEKEEGGGQDAADHACGGAGSSSEGNDNAETIFVKCNVCQHKFHPECLKELLDRESRCPVCMRQLKTIGAQNAFYANKVAVPRPPPRDVRRQVAVDGEVGEVFRQKEAAWRKKQNEDEAATWKMLVAERQGGGSGDSGVGMSKEELKIEQAKYEQQLAKLKNNEAQGEVDADEEFARKLAAELQASEEAEVEKERLRIEQDEMMARKLRQEYEADEAARKRAEQNAEIVTVADVADVDDSPKVVDATGGANSDTPSSKDMPGGRRQRRDRGNGHSSPTHVDNGLRPEAPGASRSSAASSSTSRVLSARGVENGARSQASHSRGNAKNRKRSASPTSNIHNGHARSKQRPNSSADAGPGSLGVDSSRRRRRLTKNTDGDTEDSGSTAQSLLE